MCLVCKRPLACARKISKSLTPEPCDPQSIFASILDLTRIPPGNVDSNGARSRACKTGREATRESLLQLTACAPRAVRHAMRQKHTSTTNREDEGGDTAGKPKTQARGTGPAPYRSFGQQKTNHRRHYHWQQHSGRQTTLATARRGQVARAPPVCCTPRTVYARLNAHRIRHRNQASVRPTAHFTRRHRAPRPSPAAASSKTQLSVETVGTNCPHGGGASPPCVRLTFFSSSARATLRPVPDTAGTRTAHRPSTLWRGSATMRSQPTHTSLGITPRDTLRR